MPAVAWYLRREAGLYYAFVMDVLHIEDGEIAEITTFDLAHLRDAFGLPETVS